MTSVAISHLLEVTKFHALKTYPVLNEAPRREYLRESGGKTPHILNLGTRWRSVVSFTSALSLMSWGTDWVICFRAEWFRKCSPNTHLHGVVFS